MPDSPERSAPRAFAPASIPAHMAELIDGPALIATCRGQVVFANEAARTTGDAVGSLDPQAFRWIPLSVDRTRFFLLVAPSGRSAETDRPWAAGWRLQPRQVKVADHIARGLSDKEIAERMGVTLNTARTYVKQLYASAGVHSRTELVRAMLDFPQLPFPPAPLRA